jgi:hypothetical protein
MDRGKFPLFFDMSLILTDTDEENSPSEIRFSVQNYSIFQKIDSRPLYATASLAHEEQMESLKVLF